MKQIREFKNYIVENKLDIDKVIDDFSPYIKTVINNSSNNLLTHEDKEEILVDTFFILWKNQSEDIIYIDAYLAGISRNLVRDKLKQKHIDYNISDYENIIAYYDELPVFSEKRDKLRRLKSIYKTLKEIDLKILNMFYYSSKTTKQIADELNITEANVRTKLFRIRKKIKNKLM